MFQVFLNGFDFILQSLQLAIAYLCHLAVVAFTFGTVSLELELFDFLLVLLNPVHQFLFALPFGTERSILLLQLGNLLVELGQFVFILFPLDGFPFDFQLFQPTFDFIQLFRQRVTLHPEFGGSLIHQVNRLVRQETFGDVTVAQLHGGNDGLILDTHLMVVLIAFLQATQDGNGAGNVRFIDHDGLEPAFQCLVLLEILLVFVEGRGTDAAQLATRQCRLQDVGSIHGAFAFSGTHQCVDFIDEEDDVPLRLLHLIDNRLQTFLKFAFIFGTCHERTHIQ